MCSYSINHRGETLRYERLVKQITQPGGKKKSQKSPPARFSPTTIFLLYSDVSFREPSSAARAEHFPGAVNNPESRKRVDTLPPRRTEHGRDVERGQRARMGSVSQARGTRTGTEEGGGGGVSLD